MKPIDNKRMADIREGKLEYATAGDAAPTVVFLNGGGPANMDSWRKVYREVAEFSRVFAYNRFGDGHSDQVREPQTGCRVITALMQLLEISGMPAPYVVVGHSIGGLFAMLFAQVYPQLTHGVVLVDSSHPDQGELLREQGGIFGALNRLLFRFYAKANPSKFSEIQHFDDTAAEIRAAGAFPDVPLIIITAGKRFTLGTSTHMIETIAEQQRALAKLSPRGKQIIAERSGHFVQYRQPELVVNAIREVLTPPG